MGVITAVGRLRQDNCEFEARLGLKKRRKKERK
jgi:hypothetical protein